MPKVKVEFNLPEETYEYKLHMKAQDMSCIIEEIVSHIRGELT